jgi:UDPglucose--hexose-1-phosphate uridylyltransferase
MRLALGGHDVVVVRDHDQKLPLFTNGIWQDLLQTFKDRYLYFSKIENVQYVMPIYNHGPEAAASIEHPHAQIFASSVVPNIAARELSYTKSYFDENHSCAFCDLIEHEKKQNTRVLFENDDFICFTFYAARFPFESWILPKHHQSHFEKITASEITKLSEICQKTFSRYRDVLNDPPLNFYIHSAPATGERELNHYHYHMEIAPRLSNYGGYELGSGVIIDMIAPEQAAEYLRAGTAKKLS